jgi:hypothetical protein
MSILCPELTPEGEVDDEAHEAEAEGHDAQVQEGEHGVSIDEGIAPVNDLAPGEHDPETKIGPEQEAV